MGQAQIKRILGRDHIRTQKRGECEEAGEEEKNNPNPNPTFSRRLEETLNLRHSSQSKRIRPYVDAESEKCRYNRSETEVQSLVKRLL